MLHRETTGEKRNDFLQLMVEARAGELKSETGDEELDTFEKEAILKDDGSRKTVNSKQIFTDNLTLAQSFIFFVAGFDTVGALLNFAAYLMAAHPDVQEKLYNEVKASMEESDGEIDYETVSRLEYMDMFISGSYSEFVCPDPFNFFIQILSLEHLEILRRYPPANRLERRCVKEYKIPGSDVIVPQDMIVSVSVQGIHMDPRIYPEPEKFDPERFTPENKAKRHPYSYLPFGMGPRNCIGKINKNCE